MVISMWIRDPSRKNGIMHSDILSEDMKPNAIDKRLADMLPPKELEASMCRENENFLELMNPTSNEFNITRTCTSEGWHAIG